MQRQQLRYRLPNRQLGDLTEFAKEVEDTINFQELLDKLDRELADL